MSRRAFTKFLIFLGFSSLFGVTACSSGGGNGGGGGDSADGTCDTGASTSYTNPGHAHSAVDLTAQEVEDAVVGAYTVMGGAHSHTVNLTAQDFTDLKNGDTVSKIDVEGDGHIIDFVC